MDPKESLIEYPSDFPIKVMGPTHEAFATTIVEVVTGFDPTFHHGRMEVRPSGKGNYTGLTCIVRATSRLSSPSSARRRASTSFIIAADSSNRR